MSFSRIITLCALTLLAVGRIASAFACINTFETAIIGNLRQGNDEAVAKIVTDLEKKYAAGATLESTNDLGVARLLTGKLDDAIVLFRAAEKKFPDNAKVAANLGTALELKGEDEEALGWIREGVRRDANEHFGSEWLHARIIESKIALKSDPTWLEKNRVLDLDFGKGEVPIAPEILPIENGRVKGAEQLVHQIEYQLRERTMFVKPPNPLIGDLYASAADLAISGAVSALDDPKATASPDLDYERALEYGAPNPDVIRKRLARYNADLAAMPPRPVAAAKKDEVVADYPVVSKRFDRAPKQTSSLWIYLGAAVALTIVLVAIGAFFDRRRRKRLEANPPPPIPDIDY
jgi:hypothetical protein